ncbi:uncharacterized protein N7482_009003 [Penicillium canariense]|uniref:Uncharacterized protein n=1 Tax=Penicillium canariense TaxID=189055 RepID=A0A9W9LJ34_9EURO|nr:uncharacterized protein N7482_009003 [Penicillium canariense]KAJ5157903.1 hypothetical protein N7482_009003 [Penicillium canariense]
MEGFIAQGAPRSQPSEERQMKPINRSSTVKTTSNLHHNGFDDRFLSRVRSFFSRDAHIGDVGRDPLRDKEHVEIHTWDGPDDLANPV